MLWIAVASVLAANNDCAVNVDSNYLVRIEYAAQAPSKLTVHPNGTVAAFTGRSNEFLAREWSAPFDTEGARVRIWSSLREMLPDGRLVLQKFTDDVQLKAIYEIAKWNGDGRVLLEAEASSLPAVAALACRIEPSLIGKIHPHHWLQCIGQKLMRERPLRQGDKQESEVDVWTGSGWAATGLTLPAEALGSMSTADRIVLQGPLTAEDRRRLAEFEIPHIEAPFPLREDVCGSDSCWAATQDGRLMAAGLPLQGNEWVQVGSFESRYGTLTLRSANGGRAIFVSSSCERQLVYLQLPASHEKSVKSRRAMN